MLQQAASRAPLHARTRACIARPAAPAACTCHSTLATPRAASARARPQGPNGLAPASWPEALAAVAAALGPREQLAPNAFKAIAGKLADAESLIALKDLANRLGSGNIWHEGGFPELSADVRSTYVANTTVAGVEAADVILLVGTNPRVECPVFNARLRKAWLDGAQVSEAGMQRRGRAAWLCCRERATVQQAAPCARGMLRLRRPHLTSWPCSSPRPCLSAAPAQQHTATAATPTHTRHDPRLAWWARQWTLPTSTPTWAVMRAPSPSWQAAAPSLRL